MRRGLMARGSVFAADAAMARTRGTGGWAWGSLLGERGGPNFTLRPLAISPATLRARWRALAAASAWGAFSSLRLQSIWPDWLAPALTARSRTFAASAAGVRTVQLWTTWNFR